MTHLIDGYHEFARKLLLLLEGLVCILMALLVLNVLWGVFSRYILGAQSRWTEEVAIYLLIWVSLLGAAATYRDGGHLGVDYLVGKWDPVVRELGEVMVHLVVIAFAGLGLFSGGWALTAEALRSGQISPAMGLPLAVVYSAVPLSGMFFLLFALDHLLGCRGKFSAGGEDV